MTGTTLISNERRQALLKFIVEQYINTAAPVGSASIARRQNLGVSPATIRNDMAELEAEGYITRPHTSAGGVPADRAYRFFVENLASPTQPPAHTRVLIRHRFRKAERDMDTWGRLAVAILSQVTQNVAIASPPRAEHSRIKHVELVRIHDFLILLVLVLQETRVRQQLLPVSNPVNQDDLTTMANKLNESIAGQTSSQITHQLAEVSSLEQQVLQETIHLMDTSHQESYENHHIEGLRHMLGQPEFAAGSRARQAVAVLEDRQVVQELLSQTPEHGTVRVIIGGENHRDSLRPFSVVVCQYGIPGEAIGTVSAIGPTRMDYASVITGVRYLAQFMSGLMGPIHRRS